jgi:erythromycin esterase-like protein
MDPQLFGAAARQNLARDLSAYLGRIGSPTAGFVAGDVFRSAIDSLGTTSNGVRVAPAPDFLDSLATITRAVRSKAASGDGEAVFWTRVLDGLRSQAYDWRQVAVATTPAERQYARERAFLGRDAQQGQNIIWHALGRATPRKVIVWSHIAHAEYRDPTPTVQPWERHWRSAGTVAREILGEQLYVMGFTAYEGISHSPVMGGPNGWPVRVPIKHTPDSVEFEDLMHATGWSLGFVDLRRPARGGEWLREPLLARPLNSPVRARWSEAVDGLFYMREMTPLTKAPK